MIRRISLLLGVGALMASLVVGASFAQQTAAGTLDFAVDTEGQVPEGTTFSGFYVVPNTPDTPGEVRLTDPDGDGTYTGTASSAIGGEGVVPANDYRVSIEQDGSIIYGPEVVTVSDGETETVSTSVDFGQNGVHPIIGTESSEAFYGDYGDDTIEGRGGDDLIVGEAGADAIFGGEGDDFLVAAYAYFQTPPAAPASPDFVDGGPGNDLIDVADLAGPPGTNTDDTVICGPGDDLVYAGVQDNVADDCEVVYRYFGF